MLRRRFSCSAAFVLEQAHAGPNVSTGGRPWVVLEEQSTLTTTRVVLSSGRRPGFLRLMNALKPGASFHVLVMAEESRLGREQIETSYAMKQLVLASVRTFLYLYGHEAPTRAPCRKCWGTPTSG